MKWAVQTQPPFVGKDVNLTEDLFGMVSDQPAKFPRFSKASSDPVLGFSDSFGRFYGFLLGKPHEGYSHGFACVNHRKPQTTEISAGASSLSFETWTGLACPSRQMMHRVDVGSCVWLLDLAGHSNLKGNITLRVQVPPEKGFNP